MMRDLRARTEVAGPMPTSTGGEEREGERSHRISPDLCAELFLYTTVQVSRQRDLSREDRQDLVQDSLLSFVEAFERIRMLKKASQFAYLRQAIGNFAGMRRRNAGRRRRVDAEPDSDVRPAAAVGVDESDLEKMKAEAPARLRPWIEDFLEGLSVPEIARKRGVAEATVERWRRRIEDWILEG